MNHYEALTKKIEKVYTEGVSLDEAEKLAAEFLHAQLLVSSDLRNLDLDSRMRKSGLKAVQAAVYLSETQGKEKKPTEAALQHLINTNPEVCTAQDAYDAAEVNKAQLERYYDIFLNAHIYFRGLMKGRFE